MTVFDSSPASYDAKVFAIGDVTAIKLPVGLMLPTAVRVGRPPRGKQNGSRKHEEVSELIANLLFCLPAGSDLNRRPLSYEGETRCGAPRRLPTSYKKNRRFRSAGLGLSGGACSAVREEATESQGLTPVRLSCESSGVPCALIAEDGVEDHEQFAARLRWPAWGQGLRWLRRRSHQCPTVGWIEKS
jgi:hypothetical protein